MQPATFQQLRPALIHLVIGLILGIAASMLVLQMPNGDFGTVFNPELVLQALNSGQTDLLILTLAAFGVGLGGNFFLSSLGQMLNVPIMGKVVVGLLGVIVLGGLVIGVLTDRLTGISVPVVMNPGMGLAVGSGLGWWIASALSRPSWAAWSAGMIVALVTMIGVLLLR